MRNVATLTKRELLAYFLSPMAYVVLTVFLLLSGYVFYTSIAVSREATITPFIEFLFVLLLLVSPMLTMRLFADEFESGTIETLMTAPVTTAEVVLSKYLAALFFLLVGRVPTFLYAAILVAYGEPDPGRLVTAYFGIVLLGSFFIAVGMTASACMRAQITAAVVTIVVLLGLLVVPTLLPRTAADPLTQAVRYVGYSDHFEQFRKGVLDTRDVFYFLMCDALGVFLTAVIVTVRRWR